MKHPTDGHFYAAIWNRNQVGLQAPGICMMRTDALMDPSSWRAWDGASFTKTFASPYTMEPGTEADHVCTVTNLPAGNTQDGCAPAGLVWSTYLHKFVVTLGCGSSFQWATSDDLIVWSAPMPLDVKQHMPANVSKMVVGMNYPTFMDTTAPTAFGDDNYYTIGQHPHLFWVSIGHSPYTDGRHLWATPFTFDDEEESVRPAAPLQIDLPKNLAPNTTECVLTYPYTKHPWPEYPWPWRGECLLLDSLCPIPTPSTWPGPEEKCCPGSYCNHTDHEHPSTWKCVLPPNCTKEFASCSDSQKCCSGLCFQGECLPKAHNASECVLKTIAPDGYRYPWPEYPWPSKGECLKTDSLCPNPGSGMEDKCCAGSYCHSHTDHEDPSTWKCNPNGNCRKLNALCSDNPGECCPGTFCMTPGFCMHDFRNETSAKTPT